MRIWNLGYPRIGKSRELKKALESYWNKKTDLQALMSSARGLCAARWGRQHALGVESIPINEFSFYDHMLDMGFLFGLIPKRFENLPFNHWLDLYFAMARGYRDQKKSVAPLEMTKWFNTNYHYLVSEMSPDSKLGIRTEKLDFECEYARSYPYVFHPVIVGPWTFVKLSHLSGMTPFEALERVLPLYEELLGEFKLRNFSWVQVDEPALVLDADEQQMDRLERAYDKLAGMGMPLKLVTYFESPAPWLDRVSKFSVEGVHFDLLYGKETIPWLKSGAFPKGKILSLGVVDGRNIWATPYEERSQLIKELCDVYDESKLWIAPSCSLLHIPVDKNLEKHWDDEFLDWISFGDQRLEELSCLKKIYLGDAAARNEMKSRTLSLKERDESKRIHLAGTRQATLKVEKEDTNRADSFSSRRKMQRDRLCLPLLPTSTIGSFPQTPEIRKARRDYKKKELDEKKYQDFLKAEIKRVIQLQEAIGLDVLVHGESERSDMVEYFAQNLEGFAFSTHGWVQSYGSLCVRPPVIYGDVKRRQPMTLSWYEFAKGLSERPVKGMLTGPVTLLNWSFVREDQDRKLTAFQIALALREEVVDLERAGAKIIQIDEAALREGLPLKHHDWEDYLEWATKAFRICSSQVKGETQIQTHMCYSQFDDIAHSLDWLDADVLLIEFIRSGSNAYECFRKHPYERDIGPGIYDIHSPRVPTQKECEQWIGKLLELFPIESLWINPDCGLKTRKYDEITPALKAMVGAAKKVRKGLGAEKKT